MYLCLLQPVYILLNLTFTDFDVLAGVTSEAGNAYSSGTPGSASQTLRVDVWGSTCGEIYVYVWMCVCA